MCIRRVSRELLDYRECSAFILFLRLILALRDVLSQLLNLLRELIVVIILRLWDLPIKVTRPDLAVFGTAESSVPQPETSVVAFQCVGVPRSVKVAQ